MVDRLERAGHLLRERDTVDRRRVHLRTAPQTAPQAVAVAARFFGPLRQRTDVVLEGFTTAELAAVHRFLVAMTAAMAEVERSHRAPSAPA